MEQFDERDRQNGKCTECGEERQQGGLRFARPGGNGVCDRCREQWPSGQRRPFGDPRWDAPHAPLSTSHV